MQLDWLVEIRNTAVCYCIDKYNPHEDILGSHPHAFFCAVVLTLHWVPCHDMVSKAPDETAGNRGRAPYDAQSFWPTRELSFRFVSRLFRFDSILSQCFYHLLAKCRSETIQDALTVLRQTEMYRSAS